MDDDLDAPRPKRERKQAQAFIAIERVSKPLVVEIGTGVLLSEYPYFIKAIDKLDPDDYLLRSLCSLLFNVTCKKNDLKKNIRLFNGFSSDTVPQEKIDKLSKNKDKWTDELLLDTCKVFGIDEIGDRDVLINRLVSYLMHPTVLKEKISVERRKSTKGPKVQGTKRKVSKAKVTSAYVLFSTATRDEVKANNPDGNFAFIAQKINDSWRSLEPDEKQQWMTLAMEANCKAIADEEQQSVQEEYEEVNGGDDIETKEDDLFHHNDIYGEKENLELTK